MGEILVLSACSSKPGCLLLQCQPRAARLIAIRLKLGAQIWSLSVSYFLYLGIPGFSLELPAYWTLPLPRTRHSATTSSPWTP